jgi:hypothetical protein
MRISHLRKKGRLDSGSGNGQLLCLAHPPGQRLTLFAALTITPIQAQQYTTELQDTTRF